MSRERPTVALIGVPSSAGARKSGQERAPRVLRAAGLVERLRDEGVDVTDLGDLPTVPYRPDPGSPRSENLDLVLQVARRVTERVGEAIRPGVLPVVLGGDCSLSLGVIAALVRHEPTLGLLYFDGDVDLNTPETTPSGIFDGMVLAHILGRGVRELAGIGSRYPLLDERDVTLFAYNPESGWIDPPELALVERSHLVRFPLPHVREDAPGAARAALEAMAAHTGAVLVHFDVDVMDCPAADVVHADALDVTAAFAALRVFVRAPVCAGLVVTEFNPDQDPDGSHAERLVQGLVEAIGARRVSTA